MGVYQDKKTKRFFIKFQLNGEQYKERLPEGTTRKQAETIEVRVKSQMLFDQHGINSGPAYTFERFVQDVYLPTIDGHQSKDSFEKAIHICKAAMPYFKGKQMRAIKPADIDKFIRSRSELVTQHGTVRKPATVLRELSIVSKIFSLAVRNDICTYNPCSRAERPKFDNVMDKILRREDEAKFFAAFDGAQGQWAKDICMIALQTGLRQNDILGLTKFQVDLEALTIRLTQGKTQRQHFVKMNGIVHEIIERRMQLKSLLLFPSPKTGEVARNVRTAIFTACRRAGIERLTIRDLRRTCSTRLDDEGFSTATIAKFLGHADLRSVLRYQRSAQTLQDASERLEEISNRAINVPAAKLKKVK